MCDDGWSYYDAKVACTQLGYGGTYFSYYSYAYFGSGSGSIWLDELGCSGSETSLFSCSSAGLGNHDCGHYEDAGVRCFCEYIHHHLSCDLTCDSLCSNWSIMYQWRCSTMECV